jgi:hypothetical protein
VIGGHRPTTRIVIPDNGGAVVIDRAVVPQFQITSPQCPASDRRPPQPRVLLPSINPCLPQRPIPEAGNWSTLAPVSVAGANCFLGTLACRWSMKNRRELIFRELISLLRGRSLPDRFFLTTQSQAFAVARENVSTSDLMPRQRRAAGTRTSVSGGAKQQRRYCRGRFLDAPR